jgi:hypothetical protein
MQFDQAKLFTTDSAQQYTLQQADILMRYTLVDPSFVLRPYVAGGFTAQTAKAPTLDGAIGS